MALMADHDDQCFFALVVWVVDTNDIADLERNGQRCGSAEPLRLRLRPAQLLAQTAEDAFALLGRR
jgi:hypothetical protein